MNSSLNRFFKVIWCKLRLTWVAVSEVVRGQGKERSSTRAASREGDGMPGTALQNNLALWQEDHIRLVPLARLQQVAPPKLSPMVALQALSEFDTPRTLFTSMLLTTGAVAAAQPAPKALPTGGQVSAGQARINSSGGNMVVQQGTDRAAINWQTFNVGKDAQVQFQQPNAASVTLNRVMSSDPSQIFGRITSNGQVVLSNPAGVYFGKDSRVDVGGLVATTHGISDADFMAGKNRYERNGSTGSVINEGELKAALGGYIALLAPEVRNQGAIIAQMGTAALAAGEAIDLKFDSNNRLTSIRVEPSQIQALVDNQHAVQAPGGLIILSAQSMDRLLGGVVKNSGKVEASGLKSQGGRIILSASKKVENTGAVQANATVGATAAESGPAGTIEITAPEVINSGTLSASAVSTSSNNTTNAQGTATSEAAQSAGSIQVQATQFTQTESGRIDLSGTQKGGQLNIKATGKVQLQGQIDVSAKADVLPPAANSAPTAVPTQGGEIDVQAGGDIELNNASLDASGGQGGRIALRAAAAVQQDQPQPQPLPDAPGQGRLAMMGNSTLSVRGRQSQGGTAHLLGDHLDLLDTSKIDASGVTGGGTVLVGGDWQGSNGVYQATTVTMTEGVSIDASATTKGDGGKVVLWSNVKNMEAVTQAFGTITARGGAQGGQGGRIETSGGSLLFNGLRVDTQAADGSAGQWLLDPYNFYFDASDLTTLASNLNGANVTISTATESGSATFGMGHIVFESDLTYSGANARTLTLTSGKDIWVTGNITATSGALNLSFDNPSGSVLLSGDISTRGGSINFLSSYVHFQKTSGAQTITTADGNLTFNASNILLLRQAASSTVTLDTGAGALNLGTGAIDFTTTHYSIARPTEIYSLWGGATNRASGVGGVVSYGINIVAGREYSTRLYFWDSWDNEAGELHVRRANGVYDYYFQGWRSYNNSTISTNDFGNGAKFLVSADGNYGRTSSWIDKYVDVTFVAKNSGTLTTYTNLDSDVNDESFELFKVRETGLNNNTSFTTGARALSLTTTTGQISGSKTLGSLASLSVQTNNANSSLGGAMSGSGSLTKTGTGTLTLTANHTYTGATNINDGTLVLSNNAPTKSTSGFNGTGELRIESTANSFNGTFSTSGWTFNPTLSGLTLGKASNTSTIAVNSAVTIAGPISLYGVNIFFQGNVTSTAAGAAITAKATGAVHVDPNFKVETNNGRITFWADADNSQASNSVAYDQIILYAGSTLKSTGGAIVLAGGLDNGANGGTANDGIPDNYAYRGAGGANGEWGGLNFGQSFTNGAVVTLQSAGGDITMRGLTRAEASRPGITSQGGFVIDAGAGRIDMQGASNVNHGIEFTWTATPAIAITSSYAGAGPAVRIAGGTNTNVHSGIYFANSSTGSFLIQSTASSGGGVTLQGTAGSSSGNALILGNNNSAMSVQLLSGAGDIVLEAKAMDTPLGTFAAQGLVKSYGTVQMGARANATAVQGITPLVTASSANVILRASGFDFDTVKTTQFATTGTLSLLPTAGTASMLVDSNVRNLNVSTVTNLTFGSTTNTGNITVGSNLSVNGPISIYAGNIDLGGGLATTSTTGTGIGLYARQSIDATAPNLTVQTSGASILFASNIGGAGGGINLDRMSILSNGGNITLGGGVSGTDYAVGTNTSNIPAFGFNSVFKGVLLNAVTLNAGGTSSGGNISIKGKGWQGGNPGAGYYAIGVDIVGYSAGTSISTNGSGSITIDGVGGINYDGGTHSAGINLHSGIGQNSIFTTGGAINISGTAGTGSARVKAGIQFDGTTAQIYSSTGDITFTTTGTSADQGLNLQAGNTAYFGRNFANTVTTSGNLRFTVNALSLLGTGTLSTTSNLTIEPNGASFTSGANVGGSYTVPNTVTNLMVGKTTNTGEVTFNPAVTSTGTINFYGSNVWVGGNQTASTAGIPILIKATGNALLGPNARLTTLNSNITMWADADGNSDGFIGLREGAVINTANGSTTQVSGGGRITLGGGTAVDADGLPTGFAYAASSQAIWGTHKPGGVQLGAFTHNTGSGYANDIKLYSGGGNIVIKGKAATGSPGVAWYGGNAGSQVVSAGSGTITLEGHGVGTGHGIELSYFGGASSPTLRSSSNAATAISITGIATSTTGFAGYQGTATLQSTGTGNIVVSGTAAGTYNSIAAGSLNASATGGTVSILGTGGTGISIGGTITGLNPILIRSTTHIQLSSATLGNGNGSSVVLWTRFNNEGEQGRIRLSGTTINTGGGHVWMGGGNTQTALWNGLTVGRSSAATWDTAAYGLELFNSSVNTAGGNVYASGLSFNTGANVDFGVGVGLNGGRINSQTGSVELIGEATGRYAIGVGVEMFNTSAITTTTGSITLRGNTSASTGYNPTSAFGVYLRDKVLLSSDSGAIGVYGTNTTNQFTGSGIWIGSTNTAGIADGNQTSGAGNGFNVAILNNTGSVLIDGRKTGATRTDGWSHGAVMIAYGSDKQLIRTNSGNLTFKGFADVAQNDASGLQFQVNTSAGSIGVVSTSGDIYMQGFQASRSTHAFNNAMRFTPGASIGSIRFGAASDSATYTGKLTFEADSIWNHTGNTSAPGAIKAYGTGSVTWQSTGATSVKDFTLASFWDFGTQHSSFSIGKLTENKNVILEADLFAAGPITVYGGDITLRRDLTSTLLNAPISLIARGSIYGDTRLKTISTNAGEVTLAADSDGNGFGGIDIYQGLKIDTRRHIFSVSGYDGHNTTAAGNLKYVTSSAAIDQNWEGGSPYEAAVGVDTFTLSYTHTFTAPATGSYTFYSNSDDGARLTLNNLAGADINNLGTSGGARTATFSLVAGTNYNLRYDVSENGGYAAAKLEWASAAAGISRQVFTGTSNNTMTGGAKITMGGGNSAGTGYASGVGYARAEGIRVDQGLTLYSGGKDISLKGRSWAGASPQGYGAWGVGIWDGAFTADAGVGKIYIEGISRDTGSNSLKTGVMTNREVDLRSAFAGADAITIKGSSTTTGGGWNHGIDLGGTTEGGSWNGYQKLIASGAGGGITLDGYGNEWAVVIRNGTDLITNGGPLNLLGSTRQGGTGAQLYLNQSQFQWWGSSPSYTGLSADSDLTIRFDTYQFNNSTPKIATTGNVLWQSFAPSFGRDVYTHWFNWNQNSKTMASLTIGKPTNATRAVFFDGSAMVAGVNMNVAGPITAYGSQVIVSQPLTVTGNGDIFMQSFSNGADGISINSPISKTGGGDATITLKSNNRLTTIANITASGANTGKLNMVFWSDADGTRNGGVSFFNNPTLTTKGGHIWMGGNGGAAANASTTWNGLTVGAGASVGSYSANWNGMDLQGTFNTGGGDFYAAGKTYVVSNASWDINATGGSIAVNAGSGNVTFVGNRIDFGGVYTANTTTTVNTTGVFTARPFDDSFGFTFNLQGAVSGAHWVGASTAGVTGSRNLILQNVANLGGLVIGKDTNASLVSVNSNMSIAGDISIFGGQIRNQNNASLTSTTGNLLLDADLDRGLNFDGAGILWTSGLNASSTAAGKGNVTLLARGGSKPTVGSSINDGILLSGASAGIAAGGDVTVRGWAQANNNLGIQITGGNTLSAGRSLSIDGRNLSTVNSGNLYGIFVGNNAQLRAGGTLDITAQAGGASTRALLIFPGVSIATTGTAGNSGITLQALNGGTIGSNDGNTGTNVGATITAGAGSGITLRADALDFIATRPLTLNTTGTLTIEPSGSRFASNFNWDGALSGNNLVGLQSMANITVNNVANLGGLTLGKAGNTSNIGIYAPTTVKGTIALMGHGVDIREALTAAGNASLENNRIVVTATGEVTQTADGELTANGLGLLGTGRFTLTNANNNVAVLAAGTADTRVRSLSYVDANGLTIGTVNPTGVNASGRVLIETVTGDIGVTENINTTSTAIDAVTLNAGKGKAVAEGTAFYDGSGGNITLATGKTIAVGTGGRATLYTGSVSGSTGLSALIGSGSGRFRYASDEVTSGYLAPLGTGLHAIYRQQPTLTFKGVDESVVYGTEATLASTASGLQNGDTQVQSVGQSPTVTLMAGASAANRNAAGFYDVRRDGSTVVGYGMALTGGASKLGYTVVYDQTGQTTVTPKALTAVINDDAKFVGLTDNPGYGGATFSGFVRGESATNITPTFGITRTGMGASGGIGDALGSYTGALTGTVSLTAGNYSMGTVTPGNFHIVDANSLIVRVDSASAVYGNAAAYDVTQVRYYNAGAEVSLTQGASEFNWTGPGGAVNFTLNSAGVNVGSHAVTGAVTPTPTLTGGSGVNQLFAIGGRLSITPRTLTLSATKVYDGSNTLTGTQLSFGNTHNSETLSYTNAQLSDRNVATANKFVSGLTLGNGTTGTIGLASNYELPSQSAWASGVNSATVTARALGVSVSKVYDGLATATAAQTTLSNLAEGESLTISSATLSSARVAVASKYVSGLSLADNGPFLLSNYSLPNLTVAGSSNVVTITPKELVVTATASTGTSKVYDGNTNSSLTATLSASGFLGAETATLSHGTATYNSKNVTEANQITLGTITLGSISGSTSGSLASDYSLDTTAAMVSGTITARSITAATAAAPTKVYDGTTSIDGATVAISSSTPKIGTDDVSIVAVGGSFTTSDAGTGRSYSLADISLAGTAATNYSLTGSAISGTDGTITPRPLTITATKVYDGTTGLTDVALGNLVQGEYLNYSAITSSSARVAAANKHVATITLSNVLDGSTVVYKTSNYSLPGSATAVASGTARSLSAHANNTVTITPAPLTVRLTDTQVSKVYDGLATYNSLTPAYVLDGFVDGDTAAAVTQTGRQFNSATVAGASTFTISGISLTSVTGNKGSVASDYALSATTLNLAGGITQRQVAVDVNAGVRKVYDTTTGFNNLNVSLGQVRDDSNNVVAGTGLITGDVVNVSAAGGGFDDKNAGTGKSYTLTGLSLSGTDAGNYQLASGDSISGINGIIDAKTIQLTGLTGNNKVYDGNTTATYSGSAALLSTVAVGPNTSSDGKVYTGDVVTLGGSISSAAFNSKNVVSATTISLTGLSLSGADASNYSLQAQVAASITPRSVTVTPTVAAKTYDRTTAVTVSGATLGNLVGSENFSITGTGVLSSADAGSRTATLTYAFTAPVNGALDTNYALPSGSTVGVTVQPKVLTVTGSSGVNKTYDGTNALASGQTGHSALTGVITDDTVSLTGAARYQYADVVRDVAGAVQSQAIVQGTLALDGTSASNYSLSWTNGSGTINPITLTMSSPTTVNNKVYDGNNIAAINSAGTVTGYLDTQTLGVTPVAQFANANAGSNKAYTVSYQLADGSNGGKATNYSLPNVTVATGASTAAITAKVLSLTGLVVSDKVYDGTTTATIASNGTLSGFVGTETLTLNGTAAPSFADKNVGVNKTVNITGLGLTNGTGLASNYSLGASGTLTTTASISPKALTISGISADNKVYDATTSATLVTSGLTLTGLVTVGSTVDAISVSATGVFDTKNVGTAKTVTLTETISGADAGNYTITKQGSTTANITPATLTLAGASGITKTYDGNTSLPSGIDGYGSLTGILASDVVTVAGTPVFASANVVRSDLADLTSAATTQAVNRGTVLLAGADSGNYSLSWTNGSGTINPASLTIRANDDAKFVISPDPVFTLSYSGFVNGESTSALATAATVSRTGTGETAGSYAGGLTVTGGTANNYTITRVAGDFTIVPADQLLVKVAPSSATFGTAAGYNVSSAKYLLSAAGTGTVTASGTTLTGSGTNFTTQLQVGDVIKVGSEYRSVASITNNLSLVLSSALTVASGTAFDFSRERILTANGAGSISSTTTSITGTGTSFTNDLRVGDLIKVGSEYRTVSAIGSATTLTLDSALTSNVTGANYTFSRSATSASGTISTTGVAVTGIGTSFASQFRVGDVIKVGSEYRSVAAITDGTSLTLNAALASNVSGVSFAIAPNLAIASGSVSMNDGAGTTASFSLSPLKLAAGTGTISTTSTTLTGVGTSFSSQLRVGDVVKVGSEYRSVAAIASNTSLTLDSAFSSNVAAGTALSFSQQQVSTAGATKVGAYQLGGVNFSRTGTNFNALNLVGALTVSQKALTLTASDVNSGAKTKVYDGNTAMASLSLTSSGVVTSGGSPSVSDNLIFSGSGAFVDKNATASANKSYTISGISLAGTDVANYYLTSNTISGTDGQITPRTLGVTYTGVSKTYNALSNATVTTADDRVAGDNLAISRTAHFQNNANVNDKNVGTGKSIAVTSVSLTGTDAANYSVASTGAASVADITAAPLRVSGIRASDKVYNGSNTATLTLPTITSAMGLLGSDVVSFDTSSASFADANAGVGKTVNITAAFTGADAGNYTITYQPSTMASITPRPVSVSAAGGVTKVYDASTAMNSVTLGLSIDGASGVAANSGAIAAHLTSGAVDNTKLSVSGIGAFGTADVGTGQTYTLSNLQLSGTQASNYVITGGVTSVSGSNGVITAAPLTITAKNQSMLYGTTKALGTTEFTVSGLKGVDAVSGVTLTASGNTTVPTTQAPGTHAITASTAVGTGISNYNITYTAGSLSVSKATLVVTPVDKSRVYGTASPVFSQEITGFLGSDTAASLSLSAQSGTSSTTALSNVGTYSIAGNITGYTHSVYEFVAGTGTLTITPRYLDLTIVGANKTYDGTSNAAVSVSYANPVNDGMQVQTSATLDSKNVGTGRAVAISGVTLTGAAASNYVVNSYSTRTTANVTQLASATWVGGSSGEWYNPANWAPTNSLSSTGAVPDLSNVATVVLPANTTVSFNPANASGTAVAQPVMVSAIQGGGALTMATGALTVSGSASLGGYQQTGGSLNVGGAMNVATRTGVSQTAGQLTVAGALDWKADTTQNQDASLMGVNNWNGLTSFTGVNGGSWRNITFVANGSVNLGNVVATGKLDATAGSSLNLNGTINVASLDLTATAGNITQGTNGTLTVTNGPSNLVAGGDITLDKANDFNGTVNASGVNVIINDTNSLTLGDVTATGNLDATAATNLNLDGTISAAILDLTATSGNITQGANGTLTVTDGLTNLVAGGDITLDKANDFNGTVNADGVNVTLNDVNDLTLGDVTASGTLDVTAGTDLTVNGTVTATDTTLTAGNDIVINGDVTSDTLVAEAGGDITQGADSTLTIADSLELTAGNDITLDGAVNGGNATLTAGNDVTLNGSVDVNLLEVTATTGDITLGGTVTAADTTLTAGNDIVINGDVTSGSLVANAEGSITQGADSTLAVTENLELTATTGDITLGGTVTAADTTLTAGNNVALNGTLDVAQLDVTATAGDITQGTNGSLTVATGPSILIAGGDITLDKANDFNGPVNVTGVNVSLNDTNALTLGVVNASNDVLVASVGLLNLGTSTIGGNLSTQSNGGNIVQEGPLLVAGFTTLDAGTGLVDLRNLDNKLSSGTEILAASYVVSGDARKMAEEAAAKSQSSTVAISVPGSNVINTTPPAPLAMTAAAASTPSASSASSSFASTNEGSATVGGNSSGVSIDLRDTSASSTTALMAAVSLPKGTATSGTGFSFALPETVRSLVQDTASVQASLPDGRPLPAWLAFDAAQLRFEAKAVPDGAFPMQVVMSVAGQRVMVVISERND